MISHQGIVETGVVVSETVGSVTGGAVSETDDPVTGAAGFMAGIDAVVCCDVSVGAAVTVSVGTVVVTGEAVVTL